MPAEKKQMIFSSPKKSGSPASQVSSPPWKVLIVDDEPIIHSVTELVLRDFKFENRSLKLLSAYSGREAKRILEDEDDLAVALVDVVMEEDDSGLKLIQWIREVLNNHSIRLILRTGQPGVAPEKDIIHRYEINDYKEKTELTDIKLLTSLTVAIRGYRDLLDIQRNQSGFVRILEGAGKFWQYNNECLLLDEILRQFSRLFTKKGTGEGRCDCCALIYKTGELLVNSGTGTYEEAKGKRLSELDEGEVSRIIEQYNHREAFFYKKPYLVCSLETRQESNMYLFMRSDIQLDKTNQNILGAFLVNSSLAMDYWLVTAHKTRSQKNMLIFLSEVIEHHFMENGNHVKRVSEMMYLISTRMGIPREKAELWKMASILHDMGKIGIPDHILKKPGKLSSEEFEIMKTHAVIGYKLLSTNKDEFFPDAADIALSHHEKWNGNGYPNGVAGEAIPLPARILSVIDVFDALTHKRVYKDAWSVEKAVNYIRENRAVDFDPQVVDSFLDILPELQRMVNEYPD